MTKDDAWKLAQEWIAAWNAHDLARILSHYEDDVVLTSPVAEQLLGVPGGNVSGKAALGAYFERGLNAFPDLRFELEEVLWGVDSVVLYYKNHRGRQTAEFMALSPAGRVRRVIAHYNG